MSGLVADRGLSAPTQRSTGLAFPLSVYATLLEWQEGQANYLHHGIFESGSESLVQAQEHANRLLDQVLPPPCRLLEVGIGLGTTLARLRARGYSALGITPDAAQAAAARLHHGADLPVMEARFEGFEHAAGDWDALLFLESAQNVEPLALFESADRLLRTDCASIVIMDEFALKRDSAEHWGRHHLGDFRALAARFGWELVHLDDLSGQARPTLDYMLGAVEAQRQRLMADLGVTAQQLDALSASNRRNQELYEQGVYGYALMRFERRHQGSDRLVEVGSKQAPAMQMLFREVFGKTMTPQQWSWKYGQGRGMAVGLARGERLIAHYGGVTRRLQYFGEPALGCQVCDVMVDKRAREALTRRGPMHKVGATFLEAQIGWGLPHLVGFGFPNDRHLGVAQRLGLYAEVDAVVCLTWPASSGMAPGVACELLGTEGGVLPRRQCKVIERLWTAMAASFPDCVLGVRDAEWLQHRYLQHPEHRYDVVLVRRRWTLRPVGVLVLRQHERHLELLDLLAAPEHFAALVAVARARAATAGLDHLNCWVTASRKHLFEAIDAPELAVTDLNIRIPANVHTAGPSAEALRGRWFLMAGDADFT